mmetsp:Transcript_11905/g.22775  ORF Transcript_11905/g.22775 Transcript_11905/m.22775 type:complete len:218 (+) Transcript_11905:505-1158(+)
MLIVYETIACISHRHIRNTRVGIWDALSRIPTSRHGTKWNIKHVTALRRMQGRFGVRLIVDTFYNINFTIDGPIGFIRQPKGRPYATSCWHVANINDKKSSIKASNSFQTNRFPRPVGCCGTAHVDEGFRNGAGTAGNFGGEIRLLQMTTPDDIELIVFVRNVNNTQCPSRGLTDIVVVSIGADTVRALVKIVVLEKVGPFLSFQQHIGPHWLHGWL